MNYSHIPPANIQIVVATAGRIYWTPAHHQKANLLIWSCLHKNKYLHEDGPRSELNSRFHASPFLQDFTYRSLSTKNKSKEIKEHTEYFEPPTCEMKCVSFSTTLFEVISFHLLKILLSMWFPTHNENLPPLTPTYSLGGPESLYFLFSLIQTHSRLLILPTHF